MEAGDSHIPTRTTYETNFLSGRRMHFTEVTKVSKMEGDCEAQAAPPVLEAPSGVGKGQGPLCPPLLLGVANLGAPPPGHRQTQVMHEESKRRRVDACLNSEVRTSLITTCQSGLTGSTCDIPREDVSDGILSAQGATDPSSIIELIGDSPSSCIGIV